MILFLKRLLDTNKAFVDASLDLYKKGLILPDSYCIDVDMFLENAKNILNEAKKYNINLFYMLKQVGRNPYLAKKLEDLGYKGAVCVDFKEVEVMIYGDGAFKDPVGKIWELADPVVSPAFTDGLLGTPNEIKIKYIADAELTGLSGEDRDEAIREKISHKAEKLIGKNETLGTTPRQITDLLGSLCDLTSGSGDKGTPIVLIQGYFDNYSDK